MLKFKKFFDINLKYKCFVIAFYRYKKLALISISLIFTLFISVFLFNYSFIEYTIMFHFILFLSFLAFFLLSLYTHYRIFKNINNV